MKFYKIILTILLSGLIFFAPAQVIYAEGESKPKLFVRDGCPHCADTEEMIEEYGITNEVEILNIESDAEHAQQYSDLYNQYGVAFEDQVTPVLFTQDQYFEGTTNIMTYLAGQYDLDYVPETETEEEGKDLKVIYVILGAGVVVSLAFLILSNRKEHE